MRQQHDRLGDRHGAARPGELGHNSGLCPTRPGAMISPIRSNRQGLALIAALAMLGAAVFAGPLVPEEAAAEPVRFATFERIAEPGQSRRPCCRARRTRERPARHDRRDHPADPAGCVVDQRVRLRPRRTRQLRGANCSRSRTAARHRSITRTPTSRRRIPASSPGSTTNSGDGGDFVPNDSYGFGFFPGQFGMRCSMYRSTTQRSARFQTRVEGHARRHSATSPTVPLVHAGPSSTGSDSGRRSLDVDRDRQEAVQLPREPPDAAGVRRRRGPQRHPQPRRDPLLGRLRRPSGKRSTSTTTRGRTAA